jgi:hypothetical protein
MKKIWLSALFVAVTFTVAAQHEHHEPAKKQPAAKTEKKRQQAKPKQQVKKDTIPHKHTAAMQHEEHTEGSMSHAFSRNLPMNRNSSGTAWLPDEAPMYGYMKHSKKWMFMLHGNAWLRYNNQDVSGAGSRGDAKFDAPNWFMGMGQTPVGKRGLFRFSAMLSLDPLTVGGNGYPLLFQSGETWKDQPLVDRQHPHDLFAELSVGYTHMLSRDADVFVYLGYPGEPAISAPTFMHRPSSMYNPDAPLGHHWQDATHITFGVATVGVRYKNFKLEGSSFTGREPDEDRYNFDKARFDSWSGRLSYNPSREWALQVSHGYIKAPEVLHPDEDVHRTTASVIHAKRFGKDRMLNSALVWGYNYVDEHHNEHSFLAESAYNFGKNAVYGRYEFVEKSAEELSLDEQEFGHDALFRVNALTAGFHRQLLSFGRLNLGAGTQATLYVADDQLKNLYGKTPWAWQIYLRLYPGLMR